MTVLMTVLVIGAVLLAVPGHISWTDQAGPDRDGSAAPGAIRPERALLIRARPLLALGGAGGVWALFDGRVGTLLAPAVAGVVWVLLGRTEDPAVVRRREALERDLPTGVDLLACCLGAGAAPESALVSVGQALGGPLGEELELIRHRLQIGIDPAQVWRSAAEHPQLAPLGRTVGRAHETGAPVAEAVHRLGAELRDRARADIENRARTIEVRAAAPLGLCLLPAFVLLGIVPMVVGVFSSMDLIR